MCGRIKAKIFKINDVIGSCSLSWMGLTLPVFQHLYGLQSNSLVLVDGSEFCSLPSQVTAIWLDNASIWRSG